ncbi:uncharacterized protein LOC143019509 [Oratosquilla oratoria]|uniref:uncharacterized protein LOC143019509 n=1 Tax=Oratosquilla oratoria TaxID=337810 RepID=UPI003F7609CF
MMMMARSANASTRERGLLLQVLNRRDGVSLVESRDTDALTMARKNALWDEVTQEFNNGSGSAVPRSRVQIQTLYKNMKAKARKYQQRKAEIEASGVTVGVGMAVEPDAISEALLQLLAETHEHQFLQIQNTVSEGGNSNCSSNSIEGGGGIKTEQVLQSHLDEQDLLFKEEPGDDQDSFQWDSSSHNPFAPETTLEEGSEPIHPLPVTGDPVKSNTSDPIPSPHHIPLKRRYSSPGVVNSNIFNSPAAPSVEMSISGRSRMCFCPDLHKEMVEMARLEHKLKMKMMEEERSQREQEHEVRMAVLNLRKTLLSRRTKRLKPKPKVMPNGISDYNTGDSKEGSGEFDNMI